MQDARTLSLHEARRLLRTFSAAPDPRWRAHAVLSELQHVDGWSINEQREINALGSWLGDLPPLNDLEPRCRALFARLSRSASSAR
jgi:hypothetical protein